MLVARCTTSRGDPVWKSLLELQTSGGGVDLLLVFLALWKGKAAEIRYSRLVGLPGLILAL